MTPVADAVPPPALPHTQPIVVGSAASSDVYTVRSGDTLYDIALRHHVRVSDLIDLNRLADGGHLIHPGQRLILKAGAETPGKDSPKPESSQVYTVRAGDTLIGIAARFGTTASQIAALNGISTREFIHPGQKLKIAGAGEAPATPAPSPAPAATTVTVRAGDTLIGIAARYGTTARAIAALNGITLDKYIYPGQRLKLPGGSPAPSAPSPTAPKPSKGGDSQPDRSAVKTLIAHTASRMGVDPKLALAIGYQESGWNQSARSSAGAIGIMQVIPTSGEWASSMVGRQLDLTRAEDNVVAGVAILRALDRMARNEDEAIAGYYQGLGSVRERGMYEDTKRYVANVKALRGRM